MFPNNKYTWCWISGIFFVYFILLLLSIDFIPPDPKAFSRLLIYLPDTVIFVVLVLLYLLVKYPPYLFSELNNNL